MKGQIPSSILTFKARTTSIKNDIRALGGLSGITNYKPTDRGWIPKRSFFRINITIVDPKPAVPQVFPSKARYGTKYRLTINIFVILYVEKLDIQTR